MSSDVDKQQPSRALLTVLAVMPLVSVTYIAAGAWFPRLGATSVLAFLAALANLGALASAKRRNLLTRITFFVLTVALLRFWGMVAFPRGRSVGLFLSLEWLVVLVVLLAALNLCLFPLDLSLSSAWGPFITTLKTIGYPREKTTWYVNHLVTWALAGAACPVIISVVACVLGSSQSPTPFWGFDPVSAVAVGLAFPLAVLSWHVFSLRGVGRESPCISIWTVDGLRIEWWIFAGVGTAICGLGLLWEYRSAHMYALWLICLAVLLVTFVNLARLSTFLGPDPHVDPVEFVELCGPRRIKWRHVIRQVLVWQLLFVAYLGLLFRVWE